MPVRPRPLIAVRLIGPTAVVASHKAHLVDHFQAVYGPAATCRTSTRHGSRIGECRAYLSVTVEEAATRANRLHSNEISLPDRQEELR